MAFLSMPLQGPQYNSNQMLIGTKDQVCCMSTSVCVNIIAFWPTSWTNTTMNPRRQNLRERPQNVRTWTQQILSLNPWSLWFLVRNEKGPDGFWAAAVYKTGELMGGRVLLYNEVLDSRSMHEWKASAYWRSQVYYQCHKLPNRNGIVEKT